MAKAITYECNQCGCEITVNEGHESHLMPIYCCGAEVSRVSASTKKAAAAKKKPLTTPAKKTRRDSLDMCTGCFPDDIVICPRCKRDDEGYKLGESDSPFRAMGNGLFQCLCGEVFRIDQHEKSATTGHS